jgi:hypothetical protein
MNSSQNSSIIKPFSCVSSLTYTIVINYLDRVILYSGTINTIVCIAVWAKIVKTDSSANNSQMFRYLLLKSIIDVLIFLIRASEVIYFSEILHINQTLIMKIWFLWFYLYAQSVFVITSGMLEVIATFTCYIAISNKLEILKTKLSFYMISLTIILSASLFNIYILFSENIVRDESLNGTNSYSLNETNFYRTNFYENLQHINRILKDIVPLIGLVIFNTLIFVILHKTSKNKKVLLSNKPITGQIVSTALHAEVNKFKMILLVSLNYIIFRLPYVVLRLRSRKRDNEVECYYHIFSIFLYDFSFYLPIFFYYSFNKKFEKYLKLLF